MTTKLSEEEIIKKQERLYELECSCSTGPIVSEAEQLRRIQEIASGEFKVRMREKLKARIRKLPQEIANTSDPQTKARLQRDLELLSGKKAECIT